MIFLVAVTLIDLSIGTIRFDCIFTFDNEKTGD